MGSSWRRRPRLRVVAASRRQSHTLQIGNGRAGAAVPPKIHRVNPRSGASGTAPGRPSLMNTLHQVRSCAL